MKRIALLLAIVFTSSMILSSCEKCTVCTATVGTEEVVTEYCGDAPSVADFEKNWVDSLTLIGIPAYCQQGPDDI